MELKRRQKSRRRNRRIWSFGRIFHIHQRRFNHLLFWEHVSQEDTCRKINLRVILRTKICYIGFA